MGTKRDEVAAQYAKYYHISAAKDEYLNACQANMQNYVLHEALLAWEAIDQYVGTFIEES